MYGIFLQKKKNVLNVRKTKEIIFDFRRTYKPTSHEPLIIHNRPIDQVSDYKYLGTVIDNKLKFARNSEVVSRKANRRLYFLRKLWEFGVDNRILILFFFTSLSYRA